DHRGLLAARIVEHDLHGGGGRPAQPPRAVPLPGRVGADVDQAVARDVVRGAARGQVARRDRDRLRPRGGLEPALRVAAVVRDQPAVVARLAGIDEAVAAALGRRAAAVAAVAGDLVAVVAHLAGLEHAVAAAARQAHAVEAAAAGRPGGAVGAVGDAGAHGELLGLHAA